MAAANGFVIESPDVRYGDTSENLTGGYLLAQKFTAPESGTLTITEIGLWATIDIEDNIRLKMFEHDAANNCPEGEVTNSYTDEIAGLGTIKKHYFTYSSKPTITGGAVYWMVGFADETIWYDKLDDELDEALYKAATYPTFPSGDTWHSHSNHADDFGFYAVYEVAGGTDELTATEIATGAPILAAPTIGQIHALTATEIAIGAPTLETPTIAQTHEAASASYDDVNTAVGLADPGDTVTVPTGTETWNSTLVISKGVSLIGAGSTNTVITNGAGGNLLQFSGLAADSPIRVSGFHFDGSDTLYTLVSIQGNNDGSWPYSSVRIDHNKFTEGSRSLWIMRWVYGVADSNEFHNCRIPFGANGDYLYSWGRAIAAGTGNNFFFEDNTITYDNDAPGAAHEQIYLQDAPRAVVRYNNMDTTAYTTDYVTVLDSHGNGAYYDTDPNTRGHPIFECYENTFAIYQATRFCYIRGGSSLIYNNAFTQETGDSDVLEFSDEESWQTILFNPLDEAWPAEDQIANTFIWGNTIDGTPIIAISLNSGSDAEFIVEDRDYFMHAPESSGGYEYYDDRAGAAGNGDPSDGTLVWDGDHANAYYPYTAYTYPHPLRGTDIYLTATEIATGAPALATATIGQTHALTATEIATGTPALETPAIGTNALTATEIATGAPTLAAPTLGQTHELTATEIATASPALAIPTIGQIHALGSTEITTGAPIIDIPVIGLSYGLFAADLYAGQPALDTATLAQIHALVASGIITGPPELGTPKLRIVYHELVLVTGAFTQLETVTGAFTQLVTVSGKLLEED